MICRSDCGLDLGHSGARFEPDAFPNAGEQGRPAGASQVTALLRQAADQRADGSYAVNMEADLVGAYWVRLTSPVPLACGAKAMLDRAEAMSVAAWLDFTQQLRGRRVAGAVSHDCLL